MIVNNKQATLASGKVRKIEDKWDWAYFSDEYGYAVSVTTMLGEAMPIGVGLKEYWKRGDKYTMEKDFERAAEHGRKVHGYVQQLNYGQEIDLSEESAAVHKDVAAYVEFVRHWNPSEMQTEQIVFYSDDKMQFAGTVDIVCRVDGKLVLIDLKTSNSISNSHYLQVLAYAKAYEQSYGEKIDHVFVLQLGSKTKTLNMRTPILGKPSNGVGWKVYEIPTHYTFESFNNIYKVWLAEHGNEYPSPPKETTYPDKMKLFDIKDLHPRVQQEIQEMEMGV